MLGQTLQLLHAVYVSEDGLRISELATALLALTTSTCGSSWTAWSRSSRWPSSTDGTNSFPAHVFKECDDWDDEAHDDSTYRADFSDLPEGADDPSAVHVARPLRVEHRPARGVARLPRSGDLLGHREDRARHERARAGRDADERDAARPGWSAIEDHPQIKIDYTSATSDETHARAIEPREMKVLNGHTYVRAYCTTREAWRTFRVDRINAVARHVDRPLEDRPAGHGRQLAHPGRARRATRSSSCIEPPLRWLFEPLPGAQWRTA